MLRRLALLLVLAALSPACKKSSDDPASGSGSAAPANPATMSEDELVDAALKSMETIAALAKKHASDCEALANALAAHAAKNAELIKAFKKLASNEAKQREITSRYGGRIMKIGQDTLAALQSNCANHPAVKQLFDTLN